MQIHGQKYHCNADTDVNCAERHWTVREKVMNSSQPKCEDATMLVNLTFTAVKKKKKKRDNCNSTLPHNKHLQCFVHTGLSL